MQQAQPDTAQPQGEELATQIRQVALQSLSGPEISVLQQSVTPEFIQVMAKLLGDPAVVILSPLVNLQQDFVPQQQSQQPSAADALQGVSPTQSGVTFGQVYR